MDNTFSIGDCLSAGWKATMSNLGLLIGIQLAFGLLTYVPLLAGGLVMDKSSVLGMALMAVGYLLQFIMLLGLVKIGIKLVGNEQAAFGDLFSQTGRLVPFIGATILFYAAVLGGTILLVIPGIILMLGLSFYPFTMVGNGAGVVESLKQSWALTKGVKFQILGMLLLSGFIMMIGVLALGVGLFISAPVSFLAWSHVYLTLSKQARPA